MLTSVCFVDYFSNIENTQQESFREKVRVRPLN